MDFVPPSRKTRGHRLTTPCASRADLGHRDFRAVVTALVCWRFLLARAEAMDEKLRLPSARAARAVPSRIMKKLSLLAVLGPSLGAIVLGSAESPGCPRLCWQHPAASRRAQPRSRRREGAARCWRGSGREERRDATPLLYGAGHAEIVRALLARGANPNALSKAKNTPLMVAAAPRNPTRQCGCSSKAGADARAKKATDVEVAISRAVNVGGRPGSFAYQPRRVDGWSWMATFNSLPDTMTVRCLPNSS